MEVASMKTGKVAGVDEAAKGGSRKSACNAFHLPYNQAISESSLMNKRVLWALH
jgi:hypothetical protein